MTVSIAYKPHTWVENSIIFYPHTINLSYMIVTYLAIGLAVFIIAHSYQMHNGSKYTSIRFQTEFGALSALLASILILICIDTPNQVNSAVMYDFFGNGLLNLTTLLCDSYMFYYRLCAIIKLPKWKRIFFHCYIWAFIVLPWFPTYNIIPIFFDTNDDVYTRAYYISSTCVSAAIIVYNFIVTLEFTKILLSIYLPGVARSAKIAAINNSPTTEMPSSLLKIKVVAIKSIGHCLTSCSGVFCFTLVPVYGPTIQTVILIVGNRALMRQLAHLAVQCICAVLFFGVRFICIATRISVSKMRKKLENVDN